MAAFKIIWYKWSLCYALSRLLNLMLKTWLWEVQFYLWVCSEIYFKTTGADLKIMYKWFFGDYQNCSNYSAFRIIRAVAWDFQQCGMCDQQRLRPACAYPQTDQSLCWSLKYSMTVKLLTEPHLEFLSWKGGCTGSSESTLVKMPYCWKSHVTVHLSVHLSGAVTG